MKTGADSLSLKFDPFEIVDGIINPAPIKRDKVAQKITVNS